MGKVKEAVREHLPFFEQRYQFPMGKVKEGNVPEKLANNKYQFPMGKVKLASIAAFFFFKMYQFPMGKVKM